MWRISVLICLFAAISPLFSQPIEIPETIYFAGIRLNLSKDLRSELQKQVMEQMRNKTYFQTKVNRADAYFPLIERVFEEEAVPADFKYLIIQESGMQSDVVSSSNAVGYWQFKKESAIEVGLLVNSNVDERKHIIESTRGAARYLKKNYLMLTNWMYALIAYNTGLGGVKQFVENKYVGANEMNLDINLHWYAKKFLAHKIAFEDKVGYNKAPDLTLLPYSTDVKGKTLADVARVTQVDEQKIKDYNKWLAVSHIPEDKMYNVMLPVSYMERDQVAARLGIDLNKKVEVANEVKEPEPLTKPGLKPLTEIVYEEVPLFVVYNGLDAIKSRKGDNTAKLAFAGKISIEKFLRYNDMQKFEDVKPGHIYYLESKNNRGITLYHTVQQGESLWDIAQKYGIKLIQLIKKNRIEEGETAQEGRLMYLKYRRPMDEPIVFAAKPKVQQPNPILINTTTSPVVLPKAPVQENKYRDTAVTLSNKPETVTYTKYYTKKDTLPDSAYTYHLVSIQQTLYGLSRYYGVKVDTIKLWNNVGNEGIKFDQKLIVSKKRNTLKRQYRMLVVKPGQDISTIANEIGVSEENILIWNDKRDKAVLSGEMLKIKQGK